MTGRLILTRDEHERDMADAPYSELPDGRLLIYAESDVEATLDPEEGLPPLRLVTQDEPEPALAGEVITPEGEEGSDRGARFGQGPEDYALAEWLSRYARGKWRFDHGAGSKGMWHVFGEPGIWFPDRTRTVNNGTADLSSRALDPDNYRIPTPKGSFSKAVLKLRNIATQESVLKALSSFPEYSTTGEDWDQKPELLGVANGVVDLERGAVRNGEPGDLVTRTSKVAFVPKAQCPTILAFLRDVFRDRDGNEQRDLVEYVLQVFGAALFGHTRPQQFWLFIGPGGAGKGTLVRLLLYVLGGQGQYAAEPASTLYTESRFGVGSDKPRADLIDLKGKRVAYISEPKGPFDDLLLFNHTGGDAITARTLFSGVMQTWEPTHTIIMSSNNAPAIKETGVNMRRRLRVVPFVRSFAEHPDTELQGKLEREAEGFLALLVTYAVRYAKDPSVLDFDRAPQVVQDASRAFIEANDPLASFVTEHVEFSKGHREPTLKVYEAYVAWHKTTQREGEAMSQVKFNDSLMGAHQHVISKDRDRSPSKTMTYFGLRLVRTDLLDYDKPD